MRNPGWKIAATMLLVYLPALAEPGATVRFDGELLSVSARAVPVSTLLAAISRETNVKFVIDPELGTGSADVEFGGARLERALVDVIRQIPGVAGQTIIYTRGELGDRRITEVRIFAHGRSRSEPSALIARRPGDNSVGGPASESVADDEANCCE